MVMQNYGINKVHYGLCEPKAKPQEIDAQETDQTEEHVFVRVFEAKYILYKKKVWLDILVKAYTRDELST